MANLAPGGSRGAAHGEERARAYRHGAEYISKLELGGAKLEAGEIWVVAIPLCRSTRGDPNVHGRQRGEGEKKGSQRSGHLRSAGRE
jgi:hypothetical protein